MNKQNNNLLHLSFIALDLCMINLIHFILIYNLDRIAGESDEAYSTYILFCNIAWLGCAFGTQLYSDSHLLGFYQFIKQTVKTFCLYIVVILLFIFLYHYYYSRLYIGLSLGGFALTLFLTRLLFRVSRNYLQKKAGLSRKVVVIGFNAISQKLVRYFNLTSEYVHMQGFFENPEKVSGLSTYPIIGNINDTISYAVENEIDEIYSTISPEKDPRIYKLAYLADKNLIRFRFVPDLHAFVNRNYHLDYFQEIPILSLRSEPLEDVISRIKKRLFDLVFSTIVIVLLLSWVVPIIAILVKMSSKGPVFFVQERSGRKNKNFKCYKFRSLRVGNPDESRQVSRDDDRVTKIGRFLRKTNLDELPQFFNVFIGNMSVVGPRPHMLKHTESFSKVVDNYMVRHFVKPGITGWAQVNGFRGEIKETEQLRQRTIYDIWYKENWSLWLDIHIVYKTVYLTIKGDEYAF